MDSARSTYAERLTQCLLNSIGTERNHDDLTGPELVAELKQRWPGLAVLFVTGFAGDASEVAAFGDHDVLRKPFTLTQLDQAIRRSSEPRPTEKIAAFG